MVYALFDGVIVYFIPVGIRMMNEGQTMNSSGINSDFDSMSLITFTAIYLAVTVRICA